MTRHRLAFLGAAFLLCGIAVMSRAAVPAERSVSSSRQFIVYGSEARLRGAICDLAEQTKRDALRILAARDDWKTPIVIRAQPPDYDQPNGRAARLQVNQTGAGLKFQLELRIPRDVRVPEVERQLLRAVLLEIIYRSQPDIPAGTPYVEPPDWLIEGILALAPGGDATPIAPLLTTAIAGDVLAMEKFLQQKRALLDSPSRALHRAYAAALVSMLIESPEGRGRLMRFVTDLDQASNDPLADLTASFPSFGANAGEIETNWREGVARLAGNERFRLLTCQETERQLSEILRVDVSNGTQTTAYALEEAAQFRRSRAAIADLRRLTTELLLLSGRSHPLYGVVIGEYQRIAAQMLRRKVPRPRRLAELRATREDLRRRMDGIADYLNWYEATQARVASGNFREYLRAADEGAEPVARRRDRISVYLDALETQF